MRKPLFLAEKLRPRGSNFRVQGVVLSDQICIKRLLFIKSTSAHSFLGVHLVETNPNLSVTQALHYYDTKIIHFCFIRTSSFRLRLDVHNFDTHSRLSLFLTRSEDLNLSLKGTIM